MTQQATDFREGDLVEVTKGHTTIRGRVDANGGEPGIPVSEAFFWLSSLTRDGYMLTLIDRPAPKVELPTEPGAYHGRTGSLYVLDAAGEWWDFSGSGGGVRWNGPTLYLPLTRLEPSAVTAKRVIAAVRKAYHTDDPTYWGNLDRIAREFGGA